MKQQLFLSVLLWLGSIAGLQAQDFSDEVLQDIKPWVESKGRLFGLSYEGMARLEWNDDYTTACSEGDYRRMKAIVSNPANYHCPTGYYRLKNSSRGSYLCLEGDNPQAQTGAAQTTALSSVVRLERAADGGFYIKMQGRYLYTPVKDRLIAVGIVPQKFYPVVKSPGGPVAFTTKRGTYSAINCGVTKVIGAPYTATASYWTVEPAEQIELTATVSHDDRYYYTLFAPFDTRMEQGVDAFTLAEKDGVAVATQRLTEVPAMTEVLLRSDSKAMALTVADDDHNVVEGNRQLRNEVADLSFDYFNRAFLVYGGEGNGDLTYYRTRLGTNGKLYFWQQALVILMVEDRHDFRPDPSLAPLITELLDAFSAQEGGQGVNNNWRTESTYAQQHGLSDWTWNEYNDDLLWAGLAYIRGYLITGHQRFLDQARWDWDFLYNRGWDEQLGGGLWWDIRKNEKSGLSNNPAVCMAAYLYMATGDENYLDKAKAIVTWVNTHLRNTDGSVDEKMNADGSLPKAYNVYNMGSYIEGVSLLNKITGVASFATAARKTIEYVMQNRVDANGIMSAWKVDGTWQSEFARGMATYLAANPDHWTYKALYTTGRKQTTYYDWMRLNADAAWNTRDRVNNITGCEWSKPTAATPGNGQTWEADACCSSVVMSNVTPEVVPGSADEVYVDIDDRSADYESADGFSPSDDPTPGETTKPEKNVLDGSGVMRVGEPIRVACIGNSITEGYGLSSAAKSWPTVLGQLLGSDYDVHNYGKSGFCLGKNTGDVSYWNTTNFTNAKALNPDIVIIALGTNDAEWFRWDNVKGNFKQDYLDMITEFRAGGRNPIVFCTLPTPTDLSDKAQQNANIENGVMPIVRQVAKEVGGYVLDFHTEMLSHRDLFPDHLHPKDEGAAILARLASEAIKGVQTLKGSVTVSEGEAIGETIAVVAQGGTVTLTPTATGEGMWKWNGPSDFTSTERVLTLTNVQQGGVYTVQFTDSDNHLKVLKFLVAVKGQSAGTITPHWSTDGSSWTSSLKVAIEPGKTLTFGPQISSGNDNVTWAWRGPQGYYALGRQQSISSMSSRRAGEYGVTCTDAPGRQTTAVFTVSVEGELNCSPLVPYLNAGSGWTQATEVSVAEGGSVTFGPQPIDGDWTWTGPNGFAYTGREARVSGFNALKAGRYVATRTTEAGCFDQLTFILSLK